MRRRHLLVLPAQALLGCTQRVEPAEPPPPPAEPLSPEQQSIADGQERMRKKFQGLGAELNVDAMRGEEFRGVSFYADGQEREFFMAGSVSLRNSKRYSMPLPIPERIRVVWRKPGEYQIKGDRLYGTVIGDEIIEVGTRIPQALIDELRRYPKGDIRMMFRMSQQGTLFGWDIERRPGYDPNKRDQTGTPLWVPAVHSFVGGDFREAEIVNGKAVRKGGYIDKSTGEKIETVF